jgi:hypothetical protein
MEIPAAKMDVAGEFSQERDAVEERDDDPGDDEYHSEKYDHPANLVVHRRRASAQVWKREYTIEAG